MLRNHDVSAKSDFQELCRHCPGTVLADLGTVPADPGTVPARPGHCAGAIVPPARTSGLAPKEGVEGDLAWTAQAFLSSTEPPHLSLNGSMDYFLNPRHDLPPRQPDVLAPVESKIGGFEFVLQGGAFTACIAATLTPRRLSNLP